jgi:hypothetical protein
MKKFYFPMETMRITQNPYGDTSHHKHNLGTPKDYPIDSAGVDGGQSACFAPVDMKVTAIKGVGNSSTNTIWLVSTEKVKTPKFIDQVFMAITHWNDKDGAIKKHNKVGAIVKKGEIICYEGKDGATANHLHIVVGRGSSNNWVKNSKGAWVIQGDCKPPEEVMYVYTKFTKIQDAGGIKWELTDTDTYNDVLGARGYLKHGDSGDNISKIADFLAKNVKGNYFGDYMEACVKVFQKQNGLEQDGCIGQKTLAKMREKGLEI